MIHPFADLLERSQKPSRTVVGMMSGTSADSIDVAVCRMTGRGRKAGVELIHYREHEHDPEVRQHVLGASELDVRTIAELNVRVGEAFAAACLATLNEVGLSPEAVDVIGSHGQTVYHHSGVAGARRATLQVGDGDVIAVRTGRYVLADFRARDIASGGEGAPLSPIADAALFGRRVTDNTPSRRAILNLGGIANLTVLDDDPAQVFGFDTGPANAPLDRLARRLSGGTLRCDQDGRIAASGRVNQRLLAELLETDPFLTRRPPKSTGFEMYGDAFVARAAELHGGHDTNLMSTLIEFIARTIASGLQHCSEIGHPVEQVIVAGGGVKNPMLMERIGAVLEPIPVLRSDDVGVPSDAREAMIFAVLADMTLQGLAGRSAARHGSHGSQVAWKAVLPLRSNNGARRVAQPFSYRPTSVKRLAQVIEYRVVDESDRPCRHRHLHCRLYVAGGLAGLAIPRVERVLSGREQHSRLGGDDLDRCDRNEHGNLLECPGRCISGRLHLSTTGFWLPSRADGRGHCALAGVFSRPDSHRLRAAPGPVRGTDPDDGLAPFSGRPIAR